MKAQHQVEKFSAIGSRLKLTVPADQWRNDAFALDIAHDQRGRESARDDRGAELSSRRGE